MKNIVLLSLIILASACYKETWQPDAVGGNLPTVYVQVKADGFTPNWLQLVSGNSITFYNGTNKAITIMSTDSVTIPRTEIKGYSSFVFRKDTVGSFRYFNVANPALYGQFHLLP